MVAASGGQTNEQITIRTYTYGTKGFALKASDTVTLGQTAEKIDFAKLGNNDDFRNISAVTVVGGTYGYGQYGYGRYGYCQYGVESRGYVLAFTNLKVHWNGKIPNGHRAANGHPMVPYVYHTLVPHADVPAGENGVPQHDAAHGHDGGYDPMPDHSGQEAGHTSHFGLPHPDSFGF
jgi:hypothetical protein